MTRRYKQKGAALSGTAGVLVRRREDAGLIRQYGGGNAVPPANAVRTSSNNVVKNSSGTTITTG
jgi:hypothetical protein